MKIKISNIGKIKEADVTINGITVIAGENNTGKSTVGKALYAMFNSFVDVQNRIKSERINSICSSLITLIRSLDAFVTKHSYFYIESIAGTIEKLNSDKKNEINGEYLAKFLIEKLRLSKDVLQNNSEQLKSTVDNILRALKVGDDVFLKTVVQSSFSDEFQQQINNKLENGAGIVELTIKSHKSEVGFDHDIVFLVDKQIDTFSEAIYLDDPFIIDENPNVGLGSMMYSFGHKAKLAKLVYAQNENNNLVDKIVAGERLQNIIEKVHTACKGKTFFKDNNELMYQQDNMTIPFKVANLSTGLKTFVILQTLLLSGAIKDGSLIILDEPEIHLHPEWQLLFAELIVMLQKEFNLHILLNTHSPYFLQAIEVFAEKYKIDDRCEYYLSYNKQDESFVKRVTGNLEEIYAKLAKPLQTLENLRYADDE